MIAACHRLFVFGNQAHRLVRRIETSLQDSQAVRIMRRLLEISDAQVVAENNRPAVIIFLSGYDIQQSRFTCTVLGYQPDFLSLRNSKSNILKKNQVAEALGQLIYL